jgi:hypothetical protein
MTEARERSIVHRVTKGDRDRVTVYLSRKGGDRLREFCAVHRREMSQVVEQCLELALPADPRCPDLGVRGMHDDLVLLHDWLGKILANIRDDGPTGVS